MILNIIKKLYFARIDEAAGMKDMSDKQIHVQAAVKTAIGQVQPDIDPAPLAGSAGQKLLYYAKKENMSGTAKKTIEDFEAGIGPEPTKVKSTYVQNLHQIGVKKIMVDGAWTTDNNWAETNRGSPAYIQIINDWLGAAAEENDDSTKAKEKLDADGIPVEILAPDKEDPIGRAGVYLAERKTIQDPKIYAKIQKKIKNIVRMLQKRAAVVRSDFGTMTDEDGNKIQLGPDWASSDGKAGVRGSGRYNASWEFSLAHAQGIWWPKDANGRPARDKDGNLVGPVKKRMSDGALLKATEAKDFFESLAAGEFKVNQNCARLKNMVSLDYSNPENVKIAYHKDGQGLVKKALAPELDAIDRIRERCKCKLSKKRRDEEPGCIDEGKSPFSSLSKFSYGTTLINDYVGKLCESLRLVGQLLRMYSLEEKGGHRSGNIKNEKEYKYSPAEKKILYQNLQRVLKKAIKDDEILYKLGMDRLKAFETAGGDLEDYADIDAIARLEDLTDGDRINLLKIIVRIEAEDLSARDPDIVLPIGLTVGNGDRKDNMEGHLDENDAIDALINQGVGDGLPPAAQRAKAKTLVKKRTLDELVGMGAEKEYTEMYKGIHKIKGTDIIYCTGLSLKNQLDDGTTKFGEQTNTSQSNIMLLPDVGDGIKVGDPPYELTKEQQAFRDKAYEEVGITSKDDRIAVKNKHREHEALKTLVYGLFPSTKWFMDDKDGISITYTPVLVAKRFKKKIKKLFAKKDPLGQTLGALFDEEDATTEEGIGRIREKMVRILTTHKTHKECKAVHPRTKKGQVRGELTEDAIIARKHLAMQLFLTGGSIDEILASKRGLESRKVSIYEQNEVVREIIGGMLPKYTDTMTQEERQEVTDAMWEIKPSLRGELTTHIEEPKTGRNVSFSRTGEGDGLSRKTRYELNIKSSFLEKHLLKRLKNLFEGNTLDILMSLMGTQQQLFEKLLMQVQ